jgi:predicted esterase
MDNPEDWSDLAQAYSGEKLSVTLIYGTADTSIPQANIPLLAEILQNAGIRCELEILPGVGHEYEPAYIAPFLRGLNSIAKME